MWLRFPTSTYSQPGSICFDFEDLFVFEDVKVFVLSVLCLSMILIYLILVITVSFLEIQQIICCGLFHYIGSFPVLSCFQVKVSVWFLNWLKLRRNKVIIVELKFNVIYLKIYIVNSLYVFLPSLNSLKASFLLSCGLYVKCPRCLVLLLFNSSFLLVYLSLSYFILECLSLYFIALYLLSLSQN